MKYVHTIPYGVQRVQLLAAVASEPETCQSHEAVD